MRTSLMVVVATLLGASCARPGKLPPRVSHLASRACPSPVALRAAFLADSLKRNIDDQPSHRYVTYLLNGRTVAANLRQDSLRVYGPIAELDDIDQAQIQELKAYRPDSAPPELGICPGVLALDLRTRR